MNPSKSIFSLLRAAFFSGHVISRGLLLLVILAAVPVTSPAGESPQSLPSEVTDSLTRAVDGVMKRYPVTGAVVGVVRLSDGAMWRKTAGFAVVNNIEAPRAEWTGQPMTTDNVLRIGSVTKTFTATLILKLAEADRLDLDDSVAQWLPGWVENGESITVRDLLDMTSGLAEFATPKFNAFVTNHPTRRWAPRELVRIAAGEDDRFEAPGRSTDRSHFRYRNTNYILLGTIAERAGGDSYRTLLQKHVTAPLNLEHTTIPRRAGMPEDGCHGYVLDEDGWVDTTRIDPSFIGSAGGVVSTLGDMLKWTRVMTAGEDLTPHGWQQRLDVQPTTHKNCQIWYGLGIECKDGTIGHNGTVIGYESSCYRYAGYVYVAIANCAPTTKDVPQVADALTDSMIEAVAGSVPAPCAQTSGAGVEMVGPHNGKSPTTLIQSESHAWDQVTGGTGWGETDHFIPLSAVHSVSGIVPQGKTAELRFRCTNLTGPVGKLVACGLRPGGAEPVMSGHYGKAGADRHSIWLTPAGEANTTLPENQELQPNTAYDVYIVVQDNGPWDVEPAEHLISIVVALGRGHP